MWKPQIVRGSFYKTTDVEIVLTIFFSSISSKGLSNFEVPTP